MRKLSTQSPGNLCKVFTFDEMQLKRQSLAVLIASLVLPVHENAAENREVDERTPHSSCVTYLNQQPAQLSIVLYLYTSLRGFSLFPPVAVT